jgi:hypothetical protein
MTNRPSWVKSVRTLLCTTGFGEAWFNQGVGDQITFLKLFKARCIDIFKQNWQSELTESSRARFYRAIRHTFGFSNYLNCVTIKSHRVALTRLIVSSHRLRVETGRWERPVVPPESRYCPSCPGKIEDEFHLILECTRFTNDRKRLIPKYYWHRPSMIKVVDLLSSNRKSLLQRIAKFVHLALKTRQNTN